MRFKIFEASKPQIQTNKIQNLELLILAYISLLSITDREKVKRKEMLIQFFTFICGDINTSNHMF